MKSARPSLKGQILTCAVSLLLVPVWLQAQVLEEIVVTAQKREQNLQDVGISISALSGDQLNALGISNTEELDAMVPGLVITQFGSNTTTTFALRGVSQTDFADHQEPPNAVYLDGAYNSFQGGIGMNMFDVERIEVLRGPQGTLFGRNATGGLVHIISRRPSETFEGYGQLSIGEYEQIKFEGAVSGPISDGLLGRLSISTNHDGGYKENRIGPDLAANDNVSARVQLLFKPSDDLSVLLSVRGSIDDEVDAGGYNVEPAYPDAGNDFLVEFGTGANLPAFQGFCNAAFGFLGIPTPAAGSRDCFGTVEPDNNPHTGAWNVGSFDREYYGVTGTIDWESDSFTITSITDYQTIDNRYFDDTDGVGAPLFHFDRGFEADQISQEIRIAGETEYLKWVAGFYYLNIDGDYLQNVNSPVFAVQPLHNDFSIETETYSFFGQVEYELHPDWTAIAGFRWTEDEKQYSFGSTCVGFGCFFVFVPGTVGADTFQANQDDGDYAAKVELDWRPNEDLLVYFGVTRGYKAGGFNAPALPLLTADQIPYDAEILTSYEIGFKASLFDGRARLNSSFFYYDYSDFQAYTLTGTLLQLFNADAEVYGGEIELVATPLEGWELMLGASLLDAKVDDITLPSGRIAQQDMPFAPDVSLNGLARKGWPVLDGTLALQADFNYVDDRVFNTINHPVNTDKSYVVANARISYLSGNGNWELAAFVKNFTDEEYVTVSFDGSGVTGNVIQYYGAPRWFGGSIRYEWE